ncbi:hypothetical protein [Euzebya sp.]|uniref:hypothetical protein n=1 Tax=Euzebya sp. TaxID=1971409 RepID=UPI003515DD5C
MSIRDLEEAWRTRAEGVSLLAELELDRDEIDRALRLIGLEWMSYYQAEAARRIRARYPAVFATALSGAASIHYDGGYWPHVFRAANVDGDGNIAQAWGQLFEGCLDRLHLTTFPELEGQRVQRYLARILLHAGVPIYCLGDWFKAIDDEAGRLGSDDAAAIAERLAYRAATGRLYVDAPIVRFVQLGGAYTVDFLDRSLDLMRGIQAGLGAPDGLGLPQRFIDEAFRVIQSDRTTRQPTRARVPLARPTLAFDPYGVGVHIMLPSLQSDTPVMWTVRFDGDEQQVLAPSSAGDTTESIDLPVPPRVARIDVDGRGQRTQIRVADGSSPLLLFDGDGKALPMSGQLRSRTVWALHPCDVELQDAGHHVVEHHTTVHRWAGWCAELLDLSDAQVIGLADGRTRSIDHATKPELIGHALSHVTTVDGVPVYADPPQLRLPVSSSDITWRLRVESDAAVEVHEFDGGPVQEIALDGDRVQVGLVDLTVRGPLGRGLRTQFALAPDLEVAMIPSWRSFTPTGLSPATVVITHPSGTQTHTELSGAQAETREVIELPGGALPVIIRPPGMASQHIRTGQPIQWSHATQTIATEELIDDPGQLVVRCDPSVPAPTLHVTDAHGTPLQRLDGVARRAGVVAYDLAKISDTVAAVKACHLVLRSGGRHDVVAQVRPAALAETLTARPTHDALQITTTADGVTAGIYQHLNPTAPPSTLVVPTGGTVLLPAELIHAGPLRVLLRLEDPWVPKPWPPFPFPGRNVADVDLPNPTTVDDPISALLLHGTLPDGDATAIDDVVAVYPLLDRVDRRLPVDAVRRSIRQRAEEDPGAALRAVGATVTSPAEAGTTALGLGLLSVDVGGFNPDEIEELVLRWPPLGVIAAAPHIRREGAEGWMTQLIADAVGPAFTDVLCGEGTEVMRRPLLEEQGLIEMPDDVLDMVFRAAGIVPSRLLEADAQALSGRRLLGHLRDPRSPLDPFRNEWENIVGATLAAVLDAEAPGVLTAAIRSRVQGSAWQAAPAASLALATVLRLDARRDTDDHRMRGGWSRALGRLTQAVPQLIAADLVLAEGALLAEEI